MHPAKVAKAQLVDCQTLDQWIQYKTFHKCLGYTLNFNMFTNICYFVLLSKFIQTLVQSMHETLSAERRKMLL